MNSSVHQLDRAQNCALIHSTLGGFNNGTMPVLYHPAAVFEHSDISKTLLANTSDLQESTDGTQLSRKVGRRFGFPPVQKDRVTAGGEPGRVRKLKYRLARTHEPSAKTNHLCRGSAKSPPTADHRTPPPPRARTASGECEHAIEAVGMSEKEIAEAAKKSQADYRREKRSNKPLTQ